jgi:long-subunit fatty acid transport protein
MAGIADQCMHMHPHGSTADCIAVRFNAVEMHCDEILMLACAWQVHATESLQGSVDALGADREALRQQLRMHAQDAPGSIPSLLAQAHQQVSMNRKFCTTLFCPSPL